MSDIEKYLEEFVPELSPDKPKRLSFWEAIKKVARGWRNYPKATDYKSEPPEVGYGLVMGFSFLLVGVLAAITQLTVYPSLGFMLNWFCAGSLLSFAGYSTVVDADGEFSNEASYFVLFLICSVLGFVSFGKIGAILYTLFPLSLWVGHALLLMKISSSAEKANSQVLTLSIEDVQKKLLNKMREEISKAREKIEGKDSEFEERIADIKQKISNLKNIERHFKERFRNTGNEEHVLMGRKAINAGEVFRKELESLELEQKKIQALFREIEAFVPLEEARIKDDSYSAELARLIGETTEVREVYREMLIRTIQPVVNKLMLLNDMRERLLGHSIAALQPISLERFFEKTEEGMDGVLMGEKKIRALEKGTTLPS